MIPAGAYSGNPALPAEDRPSVAVHRTLLAAAQVDEVRAVTEILIDRRQEIAESEAAVRPLLAHVRRPELHANFGNALHPGALRFYEKDKPSFILVDADYSGLLLTILVMVSARIWQLRAWLQRKQKNIADECSNRVVALIHAARHAESREALEDIRGELIGILTAAVRDLDSDRLSEEAFHSFRAILQIGTEVVRDTWAVFETASW